MKIKNFVSVNQLDHEDFWELMALARTLKQDLRAGKNRSILPEKTLGMIFLKPSLRTRVSFEVGMTQMGGHAVYMGPKDIKLGERETTEDIALVLSRYVDIIMARVFDHQTIEQLAGHATVPVINGLTDLLHPCQALADFFSIYEVKRDLEGLNLAFIGDGNNVAHSLMYASALTGVNFNIACPDGFEPAESIVAETGKSTSIKVCHDPEQAVADADVIYTDVWASMGEENIAAEKKSKFQGFRVDQKLVDRANKDVSVMHCLPAHYDEEIDRAVAHGSHSIIFEQAENRMHTQKALIALLMNS